jgi:acetyl/propionyl-CoA carboxylase alpha subunit
MPEKDNTYKVTANGFVFFFTQNELDALDLIKESSTEFHCIKDYRSLSAKLLYADTSNKNLQIEVGGEIFSVSIKDDLDQMLEKMGLGASSGKQVKEIKAPMPGLVLEIGVTDGQQVKEGDKILILEAMKMENSILIHADATIKRVAVKAGQAVEKGQVLVELE